MKVQSSSWKGFIVGVVVVMVVSCGRVRPRTLAFQQHRRIHSQASSLSSSSSSSPTRMRMMSIPSSGTFRATTTGYPAFQRRQTTMTTTTTTAATTTRISLLRLQLGLGDQEPVGTPKEESPQSSKIQTSFVMADPTLSHGSRGASSSSFLPSPQSRAPVPQRPAITTTTPPQRTTRSFSSSSTTTRASPWTLPSTILIPEDRLDFSFVKSSGAGGQNVNKVNTKVELRLLVDEADWIPSEVRERLKQQQANRINKEGYLALQVQEYRTQVQNRKAAISKLTEFLMAAWPRPKLRKQRLGPSRASKERNKEDKQKRSETKARRQKVDY